MSRRLLALLLALLALSACNTTATRPQNNVTLYNAKVDHITPAWTPWNLNLVKSQNQTLQNPPVAHNPFITVQNAQGEWEPVPANWQKEFHFEVYKALADKNLPDAYLQPNLTSPSDISEIDIQPGEAGVVLFRYAATEILGTLQVAEGNKTKTVTWRLWLPFGIQDEKFYTEHQTELYTLTPPLQNLEHIRQSQRRSIADSAALALSVIEHPETVLYTVPILPDESHLDEQIKEADQSLSSP